MGHESRIKSGFQAGSPPEGSINRLGFTRTEVTISWISQQII